jgi:signal transduction histidine kinase
MPASESLYERLRILAVEDPKEARKIFLAGFDANSNDLADFLARLSRPNEARLRQVVANAVRTHPEKRRLVPDLLRWRVVETDEFTRRAIEGALADVDVTDIRPRQGDERIAVPSQLTDVYRYVSDRMRHRMRNTMLSAQAQANRLKKLMASDLRTEIQATVAKLSDAMVSLGRELEATDVDPEYFQQRSVVLADWLQQMNLRYGSQYAPVVLRFVNAEQPRVRVFATNYYLETIFWNIWMNAQQAVGATCEITIDFKMMEREVELLISDNGEGFSPDLKDVVFLEVYSTKNHGRGRGMMEIQDAIERIGGHVELYETSPSEYRIRVRLPMDLQ